MKHCLGPSPGKALVEESREKYQKLKWHWDDKWAIASPCMVLAHGSQGLQGCLQSHPACPLSSGNLWIKFTGFHSFPSRKKWLSLPLSSFCSWKGKEPLNFASSYTTADKWQSKQGVLHMVTRGVMRH